MTNEALAEVDKTPNLKEIAIHFASIYWRQNTITRTFVLDEDKSERFRWSWVGKEKYIVFLLLERRPGHVNAIEQTTIHPMVFGFSNLSRAAQKPDLAYSTLERIKQQEHQKAREKARAEARELRIQRFHQRVQKA